MSDLILLIDCCQINLKACRLQKFNLSIILFLIYEFLHDELKLWICYLRLKILIMKNGSFQIWYRKVVGVNLVFL